MNESIQETEDTRSSGFMAAACAAILAPPAVAASLHLARSGSGFDLLTTSSHMTWGAGGCTVAIAALVLPIAALAAPRGTRR